jgi:hypothetical protein
MVHNLAITKGPTRKLWRNLYGNVEETLGDVTSQCHIGKAAGQLCSHLIPFSSQKQQAPRMRCVIYELEKQLQYMHNDCHS